MCGILGVICDGDAWQSDLASDFVAGLQMMGHRGPDDSGIRVCDDAASAQTIALGHQRLSIFDLSAAGRQPMEDRHGRTIVFNGEIFNWRELRQELEPHGYTFVTQTDTEVILAAWDRWGPACVSRFNGFWAFALLELGNTQGDGKLFLCRDRLGIKPLYILSTGSVFGFGSEITPLLKACRRPARIDPDALAQLVVYGTQEPSTRTIYADVKELHPATIMVLSLTRSVTAVETYWSPEAVDIVSRTDRQALEEFGYLLEDATRLRLRADVEVALTLSGGVDSSAIAAAVTSAGGSSIRAFTSRFRDAVWLDETEWAKAVAKHTNMEHVLVDIERDDLDREERALSAHMEAPYTSFSQLVNWGVVRAIKSTSGIKVFLTGQGGDELFLGYERYFVPFLLRPGARFSDRSRDFVYGLRNSRLQFFELIAFLLYFSGNAIRRRRYIRNARSFMRDELVDLALSGTLDTLPNELAALTLHETCGSQLQRLLRFDDRISAAFGMEGRPVFLDPRIVDFALSLEGHHKIRDGWTKYIIRRYLESKGLADVAWRRHKLGFPAPNREWATKLLNLRIDGMRANTFLNSVMRPGVDLRRLDHRSVMALLMMHSASIALDWEPLYGGR